MCFSSNIIKEIFDYAICDYLGPGQYIVFYEGNTQNERRIGLDDYLGASDNIESQMMLLDKIVLYSNKYLNSAEGMREEILFSTFWSNIDIANYTTPEEWQKSYSHLLERMENIVRVFLGILKPDLDTSKKTMLDFTHEDICYILTGNAADIVDFRDMINTVRRYRNGTLHGKIALIPDDESTKLVPQEVVGYRIGSPTYKKKQIENYKTIIQLCVSLILSIIRYNQATLDTFLSHYDLNESAEFNQEQNFDIETDFLSRILII